MKFYIFKAGEFTADDINDFTSQHIILKDRYLENGDIYFYAKPLTDIGRQSVDDIEELDRAVTQAQQEVRQHQLGLIETNANLADVLEQISKINPNDKEWDGLQKQREQLEHEKKMGEHTIETREKQIALFKDEHTRILNEQASRKQN